MIVVVRSRPDERHLVHVGRHLRQQLTHLSPRHVRGDRRVLPANLGRRFRLHVKAVVMRQPTAEINQNHRLRPSRPSRPLPTLLGRRLVLKQTRQRQPAQAEAPHLQKIPP